ncbi:hypothetical protein VTI74DRAFT_7007 [Chaetomium olivicolor]
MEQTTLFRKHVLLGRIQQYQGSFTESLGHLESAVSGSSVLELSLTEAPFAQGRFEELERVSLVVQSRPALLKMERLRLYITLAKTHHVRGEKGRGDEDDYHGQVVAARQKGGVEIVVRVVDVNHDACPRAPSLLHDDPGLLRADVDQAVLLGCLERHVHDRGGGLAGF